MQLRAQYTLGSDFVVLTGGVNLPTGKSSVSLDQLAAASLIGNDFLAFPVSNMGTGLAVTGGAAVAYPLGDLERRCWSVASVARARTSRSTCRARASAISRATRCACGSASIVPSPEGRLALGATYAAFGRDDAGGSAYNTGDRVIALGELTGRVGEHDYTVAAYNVFRAPGNYASGDRAGRENIANLFLSLGVHTLGTVVEPSVELRHWLQNVMPTATRPGHARSQSSRLATLGLRARIDAAGSSSFRAAATPPSAGWPSTRRRGPPRPGDAHRLPPRPRRARGALIAERTPGRESGGPAAYILRTGVSGRPANSRRRATYGWPQ